MVYREEDLLGFARYTVGLFALHLIIIYINKLSIIKTKIHSHKY